MNGGSTPTTGLASALRALAAVLAFLAIAGGIALATYGFLAGAVGLVIAGVVLGIAAGLERSRYNRAAEERGILGVGRQSPAAGRPPVLRPTQEVFLDPLTGQRVRVWFDAASGEREYRADS